MTWVLVLLNRNFLFRILTRMSYVHHVPIMHDVVLAFQAASLWNGCWLRNRRRGVPANGLSCGITFRSWWHSGKAAYCLFADTSAYLPLLTDFECQNLSWQ